MKRLRIMIDVTMCVFFIILMGHHITDNLIHEILGTGTIILFIIHNILNFKFYKSLFKGKYSFKRVILTLIDLLLFLSMVGIIVSAVIISSDVFAFLNIHTTSFGLKLHMLSTSWGFVIMSLHLGLHLNGIVSKLEQKMKQNGLEYIYYFIFLLLIIYGIYSFIKLNFISDMFLLNPFKAYNFDESPFVFYLHVLSSGLFIALTIEKGTILFSNEKKNKEECKNGKTNSGT